MQYLINANFASHFAGAFLKSNFNLLISSLVYTVIFNSHLFNSILTQTPLNFATSHYFSHALISGITVYIIFVCSTLSIALCQFRVEKT